jgi:hypothetical protein
MLVGGIVVDDDVMAFLFGTLASSRAVDHRVGRKGT